MKVVDMDEEMDEELLQNIPTPRLEREGIIVYKSTSHSSNIKARRVHFLVDLTPEVVFKIPN
jgi:hypothetical protein